jgi:hypothetical protein
VVLAAKRKKIAMALMVKIALDRLESKSADRLQIFSLFPLISPIRCVESA